MKLRTKHLTGGKTLIAIASAMALWTLLTWPLWALLTSEVLLVTNSLPVLLLPVAVSIIGSFALGWTNCQSFTRASIGALITIIVGVPFAYYVLLPILDTLLQTMIPQLHQDLKFSTSFRSIWVYLLVIAILEAITDGALRPDRLRRLIASAFAVILLLVSVEVITILAPNTGFDNYTTNLIKVALYGSITWGIVVTAVNFPFESSEG